ncbi:MAG TPA: AraC family transcriptional regulator [Candidatus Eisenbergiella merdavium]|uniref:AraC family transcriptional regulator n=1 Tax=Candidatus Eisenbergiella merdavium TaxID=2838551 RepID=A0A9D2NCL7_9FIRM|nr:AraC family transcriptional regulator [Candidatus Eisenbergiella merdavium]
MEPITNNSFEKNDASEAYSFVPLSSSIRIDRIYTIHYFEYMNDFSFPGERHDFWEFLCVDKGEAVVTAEERRFALEKDEIVFHQPNEFHAVESNGEIAPNLVVVSFACDSPAMDFFRSRTLRIGEPERGLIASILAEACRCFSTPLDDPYTKRMELSADAPFGSLQMIQLYLEQLLIRLIRQKETPARHRGRADGDVYERLLSYLESHLTSQLSIEQICRDNLIGRSQMQKLFRERSGCGIIDYFSRMKIDAAKQLIRSQRLNFTQIADELGYTSVHYFSRQFKKVTGMTPSEYSVSIKRLSEEPRFRK